jgi:hypothetical protein
MIENDPSGYQTSVAVSSYAPYFERYLYEPYGFGSGDGNFYLPNVHIHTMSNPLGHREQFHTEIRSSGAAAGRFVVGFNIGAVLNSGSGNAFAFNGVTIVEPGVSGDAEASVCEMNSVIKANVARKTILQLVDCAASGGRGTVIDAALLISKQYGAFGNGYAIQLGAQGDANQYPVRSGILLSDTGSVETGIDLRRTTINSGQALLLAPGHQITWGAGEGGHIRSDTGSNGMRQIFYDGGIAWQAPDGDNKFRFDVGTASIQPGRDGNASLGQASKRWNVVFAATGSINTSDERTKTNIDAPNDALLDAIGEVEVTLFQFLNSVAEKGEEHARKHSGVIAQQVAAALTKHGLNPADYSFWCEDPWTEEVDEEQTVQEPLYIDVPHSEFEFVVQDNGTAIYKEVQKVRKEPVLEQFPVFNEDGTPHITPGRPARMTKNEAGEDVVQLPATEDAHTIISRQKIEAVTKTVRVTRPKLDADGKPMTILGVRYSDLSMLMHAWNRREIARLRATAGN